MATQVIWRGNDVDGFYTSHLVTSTGRHTEDGPWGPATGRSFVARTIADCMVFENRIYREWLVRDNMGLVRQLGIDPHRAGRALRARAFAKGSDLMEIGENGRLLGQYGPEEEADLSIAHTDSERECLRWLHEVYNRRMFGAIRDVYASNVQWHGPMARELYGVAAVLTQAMRLIAMIPDAVFIPQHICSVQSSRGRREDRRALGARRPPSRPRHARRADGAPALRDGHVPLPHRRRQDRGRLVRL